MEEDRLKTYECAEACQFKQAADEQTLEQLKKIITEQEFELKTCNDSGPLKLLSACRKGSFSVTPYVLFKLEAFAGTTIVTLATWGKIRRRALAVGAVTFGTSAIAAIPGGLAQKKDAVQFYDLIWKALNSVLGESQIVASSIRPESVLAGMWLYKEALSDPSLAAMYSQQPMVDEKQKKGRFEKLDKFRKGSSVAGAAVKTGAKAGYAVGETGGNIIPFVGIGFGVAQYKTARNHSQKGKALGQIAGSSTGIPLAGFIGSRVGKAIGKRADHPTHFEEVEEALWERKISALSKSGVLPPLDDVQSRPDLYQHATATANAAP